MGHRFSRHRTAALPKSSSDQDLRALRRTCIANLEITTRASEDDWKRLEEYIILLRDKQSYENLLETIDIGLRANDTVAVKTRHDCRERTLAQISRIGAQCSRLEGQLHTDHQKLLPVSDEMQRDLLYHCKNCI